MTFVLYMSFFLCTFAAAKVKANKFTHKYEKKHPFRIDADDGSGDAGSNSDV